MSRSEVIAKYGAVNGRIERGIFAGQPLYVAYFWEAYLRGDAHDVSDELVLFAIHSEDLREFPELENRSVIRLRQNADGTVEEA